MKSRCAMRIAVVLILLTIAQLPDSRASADSIREQQWYLTYLNIGRAQQISRGGGIIVAVVDSGVDASHPDLVGAVLPGVVTYPGSGRTVGAMADLDGHGTAMAGVIAARGHNSGGGVLGIAPNASILPIADTADTRSVSALVGQGMANGIDYAREHGARVICIAQSAPISSSLTQAISSAEAAGIVIVAAAGNRDRGELSVVAPANIAGVVAVASVDQTGIHSADSTAGPEVVLSAPGVDILSPLPKGRYGRGSGTSGATAIVAGAVALVRAKYPNLSAAEVIHRLTATATDKGPPGRDNQYGYGIINIVAALTADVPPLSASPGAAPSANDQSPSRSSAVAPPAGTGTTLLIVIPLVAVLCALIVGLIWWAVRHRAP